VEGLLEGSVAVVTGGSGDIGSDTSFLLAEQGAKVIATYNRNERRAKELKDDALKNDLDIDFRKLDIADEKAIADFFRRLEDERLSPKILVNAAGHADRRVWFSQPSELHTDAWLDVLRVDLVGSFNCCREAARLMLKSGGGSIINFSSAAGVTGHVEGLPYTAAKAGLIALTRSLAYLWGPKVRVNAVAPGNIDAGSINWYSREAIKAMEMESSLKRLGTGREVAKAVLFLASDLSSFITGQTLLVDGGI
jgi:3-oxoacyl-[acyl-carrier protein] reductase